MQWATLTRDGGSHEVAGPRAQVGHRAIDAEHDPRLWPESNNTSRGDAIGIGQCVDREVRSKSRAGALTRCPHAHADQYRWVS